ncbi:phosphate/phosphite/phosphonate ABC transporter substrate-binding protein [Paenibacillus sp. IHBB 10380]|uniref:phosphate/phosphite/phosphonate ABC transporter substrate-binding protein n=1 Tax=Paenibacillus sp. IHBB 10380 TaxID=1566358 RepID=UPI0005CFA65E|nr:phosphate/phosphite/phosphonate ABC transporter substrate-binding protein [Paenibacillus sp. IHBB 10380]AJS58784.1 phosphonate-binding protein [Paenibacillus sp. IHBB 10380]
MFKKTSTLCMILLLGASLAACGGNNKANNAAAPAGNATTPTTEAKTETGYAPKELKVQFVPSQNAETLEAKTKPLEKLLGDQLNIPVHVTVSPDYNTIVEALSSKQVDVGFLPPNAYVLAHDLRQSADLLLQAQRFGVKDETGEPTEEKVDFYKAMIIVKKDSDIKSIKDLKGKKIGWQDVTSSAGYVFPAAEMKKAGIDPDTDVQGITIKGHDAAIMALLNGQVDAVAIFQDARNTVKKDVPDVFEQTRAIHFTTPIPNDTISVRSDMSQEWREKISQAFIAITEDPEGAQIVKDIYTHVGYEVGDDSNFTPVREYAEAVGQKIK